MTRSIVLIAILFIGVGTMHFVNPKFFVSIMPPYLPYHLELVYISGVFEILGGLGVLISPVRKLAGYGLIALLIAVFPANIQMFINEVKSNGWTLMTIPLIIRLPIQPLLIYWVYRCCLRGQTPFNKGTSSKTQQAEVKLNLE
ncbi:MAG: DoxX family protein [Acidobacteria bacterium]|nr:DoxX family protein [Acidobacteriota bacterium]